MNLSGQSVASLTLNQSWLKSIKTIIASIKFLNLGDGLDLSFISEMSSLFMFFRMALASLFLS